MKHRRIKKAKDRGAPKWMVTYSDMVTLILVFFILLFSMSQIDLVKFDAISESFRNRMIFDFFPSPIPSDNPTESTSHLEKGKKTNEFKSPTDFPDRTDKDLDSNENGEDSLNMLMQNIEQFLEENELGEAVTARRTE